MDRFYDLFDTFFNGLYHRGVEPLIHWISKALEMLLLPVEGFPPAVQIIFISLLGALLSGLLARRFKVKREKALQKKFKQKLSALKYTAAVNDHKLEKVVRHGIHQDADRVYETIILEKFVEMGITYFFPLFFFLIWLEYHAFTPQRLQVLTGSSWAWQTTSGLTLSAAYLYLYGYNIALLTLWITRLVLGQVRKRLNKKQLKTEGAAEK